MPAQSPGAAVSVAPRLAAPLTVGSALLRGGAAATAGVAALNALSVPSGFTAVTRSRISAPTSAEPSAYVAFVAPAMSANWVPGARRCHW